MTMEELSHLVYVRKIRKLLTIHPDVDTRPMFVETLVTGVDDDMKQVLCSCVRGECTNVMTGSRRATAAAACVRVLGVCFAASLRYPALSGPDFPAYARAFDGRIPRRVVGRTKVARYLTIELNFVYTASLDLERRLSVPCRRDYDRKEQWRRLECEEAIPAEIGDDSAQRCDGDPENKESDAHRHVVPVRRQPPWMRVRLHLRRVSFARTSDPHGTHAPSHPR